MAKNRTIIMLGLGKSGRGAPPRLSNDEPKNEYEPPMKKMGRMSEMDDKMGGSDDKKVCAHTDICPFYKPGAECEAEEE